MLLPMCLKLGTPSPPRPRLPCFKPLAVLCLPSSINVSGASGRKLRDTGAFPIAAGLECSRNFTIALSEIRVSYSPLLLCFRFVTRTALPAYPTAHHALSDEPACMRPPPSCGTTTYILVSSTLQLLYSASSKHPTAPSAATTRCERRFIVRRKWAAQRPCPPRRVRSGSSSGYALSLGLRTAKLQRAARMRQILRITRSSCVDSTKFAASGLGPAFWLTEGADSSYQRIYCVRIQVNKFVRASKLERESGVVLRGGLRISATRQN
ncbi:hypothetical protein DFH06DRAFT_248537 [Mycena polygramma]|nr:hypothetical protein DFH06DRAFT_248537 [Mycena polygramma]